MTTQHWKGPIIPSVGDDLLDAWPDAFDTAGIYIPCASVAAARTILAAAIAAGHAITPAAPAMFLVGSGAQRVAYVADGTKNTAGVYVLSPINEPQRVRAGRTQDAGVTRTLAAGASLNVITTNLGAVPYDRAITIEALCFGTVTGNIWLRAYPPGEAYVSARFSAGDSQSQPLPARGKILAGQDPDIKLDVIGGAGGGSITFGASGDNTVMFIDAFPITMA